MTISEICAILVLPTVIISTLIGCFLNAYIKEKGIVLAVKFVTYIIIDLLLLAYVIYAVRWHIIIFKNMNENQLTMKDVIAISSLVVCINVIIITLCFLNMTKIYRKRIVKLEENQNRIINILENLCDIGTKKE